MRALTVLLVTLAVAIAESTGSQRIVGGSLTTINNYPDIVALLFSATSTDHRQWCGGIILNQRSVLSAAHCTYGYPAANYRARAGSSYAHSGGVVYAFSNIINHSNYNNITLDNDICILRTSTNIVYSDIIQAAMIASSNYVVNDYDTVWAAGWGDTSFQSGRSEQLRHVNLWAINQFTCRSRYAFIREVTDNMLCSGWLDIGGHDQCPGDFGGPLYHNKVVVGVGSWTVSCGSRYYPGVNVRVSRYTSWIQNNA